MHEIILHHYPQSPVAEKVRLALGIKAHRWSSVQIPRIPPKPDLMPLTGGYRRTPVMQIGADIYCDSQGILRELQRRKPEPSFFPEGGIGLAWGISRWVDEILFPLSIRVVIGSQADDLDPVFFKDRASLYFGPDSTPGSIAASVPHAMQQLTVQLGWIDTQLRNGNTFIRGEQPGLEDIHVYYVVWFIRGRYEHGPALVDRFSGLRLWEQRMAAIGHGDAHEISAGKALEIARDCTLQPGAGLDGGEELSEPDEAPRVSVQPDGIGDDPAVEGKLQRVDDDEIVITRQDGRVGRIAIHFPRVGYRIDRLG